MDYDDGKAAESLLLALAEWNSRSERFWRVRLDCARARLNEWTGQAPSGLLERDYINGEPAPFDGASDQRVWWTEGIIGEKVSQCVVALLRATAKCEGRGAGNGRFARAATALLGWMVERLGRDWIAQWAALLSYAWQDMPGVAAMEVRWERRFGVRTRQVTMEELVAMAQKAVGAAGDAESSAFIADRFAEAMQSAGEGDLSPFASLVQEFFPSVATRRALKVARQLVDSGEAEFPERYVEREGPRLRALRYGDDFIVPDNATDFDRATPWFISEWLTEGELRGRIESDGWDKSFVEDVLGQEGVGNIDYWCEKQNGGLTLQGPDARKGLYNVLWAYWIGEGEDGISGRWVSVVHRSSRRTAFGRRPLDESHGGWPAVFYRREVMSSFLLDSRGVGWFTGPMQGEVKAVRDAQADAAVIWSLPPIISFNMENHGDQYLEPLKLVKGKRDARFEPMRGPQQMTQGRETEAALAAERDWLFGRAAPNDPDPSRAQTRREFEVLWFLSHVRDCLEKMLCLCREKASDEVLAAVLDSAGEPAIRDRADIAGMFSLRLVFDPADLDVENVSKRLKAGGEALAFDAAGTIDRTLFAQSVFHSIYPYAPQGIVRDEGNQADELKDEARNLALIRSGVMPEMDVKGNWDYAARRAFYDRLAQRNPAVFADMGDDKKQLLGQWLEALAHQAEQFGENVGIGRTGARGVEEE